LRHGALWRELPRTTDWFEVEVRMDDLEKIRMFPRAQWRKLARGNFAMTEVAKSIAAGASRELREKTFVAKIEALSDQLRQDVPMGTVLLIALNESGPFTILDGNHWYRERQCRNCVSSAAFRPAWRNAAGIKPIFQPSCATERTC
jgi:hypothetical protein